MFSNVLDKDNCESSADTHDAIIVAGEDTDFGVACQALACRLGEELRAAKSARLSCGEVLLPVHLLPRAAANILAASEKEPCGLRLVLLSACSKLLDI